MKWWWLSGLLLLAGVFGAWELGFRPETLRELMEDGGPALARYAQPDGRDLPALLRLLMETVAMGFWGTIVSIVLAIPLTTCAARGFAPAGPAFRLSREFLNFCRAMPDALLALVFIQALGLGPLAGALALGVHSAGFLGKAFAESMERVPKSGVEGLAACGASRFQTIRFCAWPSIERETLGYSLYILDRNVRVATTLGIVGAGGIGVELLTSLRTFDTARAATIIVLIITTVLVVDASSAWLRTKLK